VRVDIRRIAAIKDGDAVIGNRTKLKVVKNKLAPPFREVEFDILYGEGISKEGDLVDLGVTHNVIDKSGSWFSYSGDRIGQGRENARNFLRENADIRANIDRTLREKLGLPVAGAAVAAAAAAAAANGSAAAVDAEKASARASR
jgi:recombination protein RecA